MREFLRKQIFERFPLFFGAATCVAAVILVAWLMALRSGPLSMPVTTLVCVATLTAAVGAWGVPRLTVLARTSAIAQDVERLLFATGFVLIALAATIAVASAAFGVLASLLAIAGLSPDTGLALFRAGTLSAVSATGVALIWGFHIEGRLIEVTQQRVEIAGLDTALRGRRIAHLSDLHIGNGLDGRRLAALVERVNALGADLVAVTGDLFDNDATILAEGARALNALRAPLGVYAVLGNHDLFVGAERVANAIAENAPAIALLRGRWVVASASPPLLLGGVDDPGGDWAGDEEARAGLEKLAAAQPFDGPSILLAHRPEAFPIAAALGFSLVLSGHYHGGQVAIPLSGGRLNTARLLTRFDRGLHRIGGAALYVSRGLGFAGPRLRVASRPEIALLELA